MAVMRNLVIDGQTYETVGEVSVTQVVSSGTKIATVTIDGTGTDIYAPGGGSDVSVTQIQTTGTKIATITVDSVGTDLYSPSYSTLTTQEVEDAVDAAFAVMYGITDNLNCKSITTDGTYGADVSTKVTEAREGATVTIAKSGSNTWGIRDETTSQNLPYETIDSFDNYGVYTFTMPDSEVTIYLR